MAEGGNVPELGGYDYEFTSRVPEDWECFICQLTMKDPVQILGCGHRLCKICMESLLRRPSPTCPIDRQPLSREKIFPDAACHRSILDLTVKCSYSDCPWTGELRAVEKHQSECLFKVVKCPNPGCTEKLQKKFLQDHLAFNCSWREISCEYCQETFIVNQKQEHLDVCRKFPVHCTNKCGLGDIPREKLEVHVRDECPATEVQCEYKSLGCEAVFPRSNAKSHSDSQVKSHLNLALRGLETTQNQVRTLDSLVEDQSQKMERLMSKVKEQSEEMKLLMSKNKDQSQKMERLTSKVKEQSEQMERMNYAPRVWKIPNFQAVHDRAVTGEQEVILSEPFYLSKCGYKLRIKMMPNGSGTKFFKGNYLSLFVKVVPGEYDSVLKWPFTEKVRVTLIDQDPQDTGKNISRVIDFKKKDDPIPRPLTEKDEEYGVYAFVEKKELLTRSYIKNNTIFIMVSKEE